MPELGNVGVEAGETITNVPSIFYEVLQHYRKVFEGPNELPSQRSKDHSIVLQPGVASINMHLYRYPYV